MSVVIPVPVGFGWVILSGVASIITAGALGAMVGPARKKHGVEYPNMYDNSKPAFNAIQRGHQNLLETHYAQLWLMSIAGLRYPTYTAIAGAIWSIGRVIYFYGYQSGDVKRRIAGSVVFAPAFLTTLTMASMVGLQLLGYIA